MTNVKYTFKCIKNCCNMPCRFSIVEHSNWLYKHKDEIIRRLGILCLENDNEQFASWEFERMDNISKKKRW